MALAYYHYLKTVFYKPKPYSPTPAMCARSIMTSDCSHALHFTTQYADFMRNACRWVLSVSSAITSQLKLLLVEDNSGQELAYVEGPGCFQLSSSDEYSIVINCSQQDLKDLLWVRIIIASGLVAAKQQRKRPGKPAPQKVYDVGDVMWEE